MTHLSPKAGQWLAALALLGLAAAPASAGLNPTGFVVTLDHGGTFTAVRPTSGQATVSITGSITNQSAATETFTENVTGPTQGAASLSASGGGDPFIVNGGSVPAFATVNTDFVDLLLSPSTPLGTYSGSLFLSDGNANALPTFTVTVVSAVPEPSTVAPFALAGMGLAGLSLRVRRRQSRAV